MRQEEPFPSKELDEAFGSIKPPHTTNLNVLSNDRKPTNTIIMFSSLALFCLFDKEQKYDLSCSPSSKGLRERGKTHQALFAPCPKPGINRFLACLTHVRTQPSIQAQKDSSTHCLVHLKWKTTWPAASHAWVKHEKLLYQTWCPWPQLRDPPWRNTTLQEQLLQRSPSTAYPRQLE